MKYIIFLFFILAISSNSYPDELSDFLEKRKKLTGKSTDIQLNKSERFSKKEQLKSTEASIEMIEKYKRWYREATAVNNSIELSHCYTLPDDVSHECLAEAYAQADNPRTELALNNCEQISDKKSGIYLNCISLVNLAKGRIGIASDYCYQIELSNDEDYNYHYQCKSSVSLAKGKIHEAEDFCKTMKNRYDGMYDTCIGNIILVKDQMQQQRDAQARAEYEAQQETEKDRRAQERIDELDKENERLERENKILEREMLEEKKAMKSDYDDYKEKLNDKKLLLQEIEEGLNIDNLEKDEPEIYNDLKESYKDLKKIIKEDEKLLKEIKEDPVWD